MSIVQFLDHYKEKGFNFNSKLLTKYCLSLYTKPFVILSGISGTGKTKIAQLFEVFVDEDVVSEEVSNSLNNSGYIIMNLTNGVLHGDGRGNLKFGDLSAVFEESEIPAINQKIIEYKARESSDNITEPEIFSIETGNGEFRVGLYLQRAASPLLRVRFKSRKNDENEYDSQEFLKQYYHEGDVLKLTKVGNRRLRVVSVNDKEVITLDNSLDRHETKLVNNKLFISVKSNWTDNTELFGFYNLLEEKYNITPLLKFILTANEHPSKPFFLILDEMNLSRVEHYFSDFLSCLESRLKVNEVSTQEPIRLHNNSSFIESNDNYFDLIPSTVKIPYNLYITGTVNIDETTFAFSPKVLDRANVIEFNDVNLSTYNDNIPNDPFTLTTFPKFGVAAIASSKSYQESPEAYKNDVESLLNILQPYNLHFGYRVINEMAMFVNNSIEYVGDTPAIIQSAIDIQIAQKVLPKFNGAFGKLDLPIRELMVFMLNKEGLDVAKINISYIEGIDFIETAYPESLSKLSKLYTNLVQNGFASFME